METKTVKLTLYQDVSAVVTSTLETHDPSINSYPGQYILDSYDPEFLEINRVEWSPSDSIHFNPSLNIKVTPKKTGHTVMTTNVQYNQFHPLFIEFRFEIEIKPTSEIKWEP